MTKEQIKKLEDDLWDSANSLRAYGGIKASEYAAPVLGLIFLRFADNKYSQHEPEILQEFEKGKGTRLERKIESIALDKCGFYIPDYARYENLLALPDDNSMAEALREAMKGIEEHQDEKFKDLLPTEIYFQIERKKKDILPKLLKTFSDIPKDASGDVFGKIYEYFLGEFAKSEGQKGGEFFTPTSVVRFIVEVIEPYAGNIFDPACGSGGMFVQSARFIREASQDVNSIYVHGQEYMGETARLARMNLLVNSIRGEIKEVNSYESDAFVSHGKFDFVMANPPFNVKSVKESTVKNDARFYTYGLPKNKGKNTDDSITDANYLWVSLFATSLKENGRAGFVMPNSASDAGNSEYDIRKKMVDTGMVDCMVSMPSNMFLTVTLPATLWFFDKAKTTSERKDQILFIDARNTFTQINRAQREWNEEQVQNLTSIVRLYRGENGRYLDLVLHYAQKAVGASAEILPVYEAFEALLAETHENIRTFMVDIQEKRNTKVPPALQADIKLDDKLYGKDLAILPIPVLDYTQNLTADNAQLRAFVEEKLGEYVQDLKAQDTKLKNHKDLLAELWGYAEKLKIKNDKDWTELKLNYLPKSLEQAQQVWKNKVEEVMYWQTNLHWLQSRFPDAVYQDVIGLCKVASKKEYAEEQDYSLNAGRYVGVEIEGEEISREEFISKIIYSTDQLKNLTIKSKDLEKKIFTSLLEFQL